MPVLFADAASFHRERLESAPERFSAGVLSRLQPGLAMRALDYAGRIRWLESWREECRSFFAEVDAMITPTVPMTAPLAGDDAAMTAVTSRLSRFCWAWPAAGSPAMSVPCGFSAGFRSACRSLRDAGRSPGPGDRPRLPAGDRLALPAAAAVLSGGNRGGRLKRRSLPWSLRSRSGRPPSSTGRTSPLGEAAVDGGADQRCPRRQGSSP